MSLFKLFFITYLVSAPYVAEAACQSHNADDEEHENILRYAPLIVTAPTSVIAAGVGYTLDGTIYVGAPLLITSAICLPIGIVLPGDDSARFIAECMSDLFRTGNFHQLSLEPTTIGSTIWNSTHSWRCPL